MERSHGLEALDTTSPPEEPTSLPGAGLRCGSQTSHSHNPSNSDPLALTRGTLVCTEDMGLTNGVNHSRAATKGTNNKDTKTTTQHTTKANTLSNLVLIPLTKALDKIAMLISSQISFLTFLNKHTYQTPIKRSLLSRLSAPSFALLVRPTDRRSPLVQGAWAIPYGISWWFVRMFIHSIWTV